VRDWFYPYYCGAGRGMRTKYNETSGRWRKRVFTRVRWIFVALAVPIVVGSVVAILGQHPFWIWGSGMAMGALMTVYIAARESPPGYIENWRTGFEGERRTARVLAPLRRDGYALLHDLPDRRSSKEEYKGDIDHVVVCTAGVFLLNSKWLGGEVSIRGETVHVQRRDDDDDSYQIPKLASGMRGCAVRLQEDIAQHTGVQWVQPVVVFWDKFDAELVVGDKIVFVHAEQLTGWLREQKPRMTAERVAQVAACIQDARPSKHRRWWSRVPTLGLRGQRGLVVTGTADGAGRES
jgi:Nuclease-related domain